MRDATTGRRQRIAPRPNRRGRFTRLIVVAAIVLGAGPVAAQETTTTTTSVPETTTTTTTTTTSTTTVPDTTTTTGTGGSSSTTTTTTASTATTTSLPGLERQVPVDSAEGIGLTDVEIAALLNLQQEYDELVAEESSTLAEYSIRLGRVEELDAALAVADADIAATERELDRVNARVASLGRVERTNIAERNRTAVELEDAQDRLREQAIESFVVGGATTGRSWEVVLDADNAHTAGIAMTYAGVAIDLQQATIEDVRTLEAQLETIAAAIDAASEEAEQAQREVEELEQQLEEQRSSTQAERDRAEEERVELDAALTAIRNRKADYDRRLQTMAIESDNITSVLARAQRDQTRADSIPLLRGPLDPTLVTSGFGPRLHPIFHTVRRHNGLDLNGSLGDPIRAIDDGIVVMAELREGFGNTIVIDHGDRVASLYAHQSRFEVSVGDTVERGELIGRVGSTGWSTGPHLHLELRITGVATDPSGYLVRDEQVSCQVLTTSEHAIDQTLLAQRPDCG